MQFLLKAPPVIALTLLAVFTSHAAPRVDKIEDLKSLQSKLKEVVKKTLPATVSVFSMKNGASGSGVIVSKDGLVLTAGHVVSGLEEVTLVFPHGKQARGKVLGANYTRDSAMIQIIDPKPPQGWPYAQPGQSGNLKSGDLVVALGHAGGYDPVRTPPVRFGRVLACGPDQFLTTDCALIGGDSGGPLFDLQGKVVGIHSSIGQSLNSNNHTGIDGFKQDWKKLKQGDTWGRLGSNSVLDSSDSPVLGIEAGGSARGGVIVRHVFDGGPAAIAGLKSNDIIISLDERPVHNLRSLLVQTSRYKPGDRVKLRIARGADILERSVKLGRRGDIFRSR